MQARHYPGHDARELSTEERGAAGTRRWGLAEKAKLTRKDAESLGIEWKPHAYLRTSSTDQVDRYGDIIEVKPWDTKAFFEAGAGVLWGHNRSTMGTDMQMPPIGTVLKAWIEISDKPGKSKLRTVHHYHRETQLSEEVERLVAADILRASSVGFLPDWTKAEDITKDGEFSGVRFKGQELLEDSVVCVPANPGAVLGRDFPAFRAQLEQDIAEGNWEQVALRELDFQVRPLKVEKGAEPQTVQDVLRQTHQALKGPVHFVVTKDALDDMIAGRVALAVEVALTAREDDDPGAVREPDADPAPEDPDLGAEVKDFVLELALPEGDDTIDFDFDGA